MSEPCNTTNTTAVVLAGGQAQRMEGRDKGLELFHAEPLVAHALRRLQQQTSGVPAAVAINANRNLGTYAQWNHPVWPDSLPDFPGPLAGFLTGLDHITTPYLLTVPCDCPLFPLDLFERLSDALNAGPFDLAMAYAPETQSDGAVTLRPQPVFALMRQTVQPSLRNFLASGGRKIGAWTATLAVARVPFDRAHDHADAFANANTRQDLESLERR